MSKDTKTKLIKTELISTDSDETLIRIMTLSMRESKPVEPWKPAKMKAMCCGDVIWSAYPGQFKSCKCGEAFVDQTRYYGRSSGRLELHEAGEE